MWRRSKDNDTFEKKIDWLGSSYTGKREEEREKSGVETLKRNGNNREERKNKTLEPKTVLTQRSHSSSSSRQDDILSATNYPGRGHEEYCTVTRGMLSREWRQYLHHAVHTHEV